MTKRNNYIKVFLQQHRDVLVCLLLIMATFAVYWQARNYDFVNFDDQAYVYDNRYVQAGLTLEGIIWAFTTNHEGNWHPLTWLSHMLDCELYGMNPGRHHLTNLFFHIANTLLLFFVFRKMTGSLWQSGFVAALFALHPLHVESVVWVSERKDVLSTFFWMLTMWSYIRYVEHPTVKKYLPAILFFTLGLMSKAMLVTLPFVLLLLDFYPLDRFQLQQPDGGKNSQQRTIALNLVIEKLPLLSLAVISCAVTFYAQKQGGAVASIDVIPLNARIANALVSYVSYIGNMLYPSKLAVLYPLPEMLPWWKSTGACLLLVSISFTAIKYIKQSPYFIVGWLWYTGTLIPVIGLVQVGIQSMADRYTYVPLIGLFIIIAWGVPDLMAHWRHKKIFLGISAFALLSVLMAVTWKQLGHWENSITLFSHTLEVTSQNSLPHNNLGVALDKKGRTAEAIKHYLEALQIKPNYVEAHYNLGNALNKKGRTAEAIDHYLEALRIKPENEKAHSNLGNALEKQGHTAKAIKHYLEALRVNPDFEEAHNNLGVVLEKQGHIAEAIEHYLEALRIKPDFEEVHNNLGLALETQGHTAEAIKHYLEALRLKPDYVAAHNNLGLALETQGHTAEAIEHYLEALRIKPDYAEAHNNLGNALNKQGRTTEAIDHYLEALRIKHDFVAAHNNLGITLFRKGDIEGAIACFREAIRIKPDSIGINNNLKKLLMIQKQRQ